MSEADSRAADLVIMAAIGEEMEPVADVCAVSTCERTDGLRLVQTRFGFGRTRTRWGAPKLVCPDHRPRAGSFRYADRPAAPPRKGGKQ